VILTRVGHVQYINDRRDLSNRTSPTPSIILPSINFTGTMGLLHGLISLLLGICIGAECKNAAPMRRKIVGGAPQVTIPQATVEGFLDLHNNTVFLGIPFAATTGGQNR
jgi:hypothetical protein